MNGLKYIRIRCNYSQRSLAEAIGVSRQAINMWENSKKLPSEERKKNLCDFFGVDNPEYFGELSDELYEKLQKLPVYKTPLEGENERFSFKPCDLEDSIYKLKTYTLPKTELLTLDEKCNLKRIELKNLFSDICNYATINEVKNTNNNLVAMNRAIDALRPVLDLLNESHQKHPEYAIIYYRTILAVLDALGISFGNIEKADILAQEFEPNHNSDWYDYRNFSIELSEIINKHLDNICEQIPTKRVNPHDNYRRRVKKVKDN